jgi:bacteriocin biosynthesis cyclodehydratase domain-containing protein
MSSEPTFTLDPVCPVLPRPDSGVQIGWAPRRAVIVRPSTNAPAAAIRQLLSSLSDELTWDQILNLQCVKDFHDIEDIRSLLDELVDTGAVIRRTRPLAIASPMIRIVGRGPLSDALAVALRHSSARIQRSTQSAHGKSWQYVDLAILADDLIVDTRLLRTLTCANVPHLAVRARDGTGLIGPMVLPGITSCLECADRHRRDRDEQWPAVAAQLTGTVGVAAPATVLGTAAVALAQIDRVLSAIRGQTPGPLATLNATLELDLATHALTARHWTAHPLCECGAYFATS